MGEEDEKAGERWRDAILNLSEAGSNIDSLQKLVMKKAVFVDDDTYVKASVASEQARIIKVVPSSLPLLDLFLNERCLYFFVLFSNRIDRC